MRVKPSRHWKWWLAVSLVGYVGWMAAVDAWPESILASRYGQLGLLYATLLYVSGAYALYLACRQRPDVSPLALLADVPSVSLPLLVGLVGTLHGYVSVMYVLGQVDTIPSADLYSAYDTLLQTLLVGAILTLIAFAILAVRMSRMAGRATVVA